MKLEPGKTVIGLAFVTDEDKLNSTDFTVYYGNALEPMINNRVLHLKDKDYRAMLKAFLDGKQLDQNVFWIEEGGREYDIPTEKEVRAASLEMLNREAQMLKSLEQDQQQEETDKDSVTYVPESIQASNPELEKKVDSLIGEIENRNNVRYRRFKIANIALAAVTVLSLAATGYMFYRMKQGIVPEGMTQISINGTTYDVPLADINVEDGESKILIYGFTTSKKDGQVTQSAVPLGEFKVELPEDSKEKTEPRWVPVEQ
jgi:hypothetical protein